VCLPLYKAFVQMNPKLAPLKEGCRENKLQWQKLADDHKAQVCTFCSFFSCSLALALKELCCRF